MTEGSVTFSSTKYCCDYCNKQYTAKSSLKKHLVLCEFQHKTPREKKIEMEESSDLPDYNTLVKIVQDLSQKNAKLEEQIKEFNKWVDKKKRKVNVIEWLNTTYRPNKTFSEWCLSLRITEEELSFLMQNTIVQTFEEVLNRNLEENTLIPIKAFNQKASMFYVCVNCDEENVEWRVMGFDDMKIYLRYIQTKLLELLTAWREVHKEEIMNNDKVSKTYNESIIKLMNVNYTHQDTIYSRIRSGMYARLKTDLRIYMEYDIEF